MAVSDDEIIRRRLLIEGDGGGDDRRITSTLKTFIKWSNTTESPEDSNSTYQKVLASLSHCEFAMEKSLLVQDMNTEEQSHYEQLYDTIETSIKKAKSDILDCKDDLVKAKKIRKNRQEYDVLAKVIQQHPDRQDTLKQLTAIDQEFKQLKDTKENLEGKLDLRKKQFHVLIAAIHELQRTLEDDDKKEETSPEESMETT